MAAQLLTDEGPAPGGESQPPWPIRAREGHAVGTARGATSRRCGDTGSGGPGRGRAGDRHSGRDRCWVTQVGWRHRGDSGMSRAQLHHRLH